MGTPQPGEGQDQSGVILQTSSSLASPETQQGRVAWESKVQPGLGSNEGPGHLGRVCPGCGWQVWARPYPCPARGSGSQKEPLRLHLSGNSTWCLGMAHTVPGG